MTDKGTDHFIHNPLRRKYMDRLLAVQDGRCFWCERNFKQHDLYPQIDHRRPRRRGGSNRYENLRALCKTCNSQKQSRTEAEHIMWMSRNTEKFYRVVFGD